MEFDIPGWVLALGGALGGGTGVKLLEPVIVRFLTSDDRSFERDMQLSEQLKEEMEYLRERVDGLDRNVTLWKDKYYKLVSLYLDLTHKYRIIYQELRFMETSLGAGESRLPNDLFDPSETFGIDDFLESNREKREEKSKNE